ncbi:MAG: RlmE family RNA methyltransferase [Planctomycetota bacterium]|nr:RlmE family RNA methyltransferase [Planctomycetota bacterium]
MAKRVLHDKYFKLAKAEGYVARSAYKLLEIDERYRVLNRGKWVLDVGCAPGSWLQVAAERVGPRGRVVGIDLQRVDHRMPDNVVMFEGDAEQVPPEVLLELVGGEVGGDLFHSVLSDMAPKTTGHVDDLVSARLCRSVLKLLPDLLRPGGHLVMKILEGQEYPLVLRETQRMFDHAKGFKPNASRDVSREMFIVGKRFKGPRPAKTADSNAVSPESKEPNAETTP